MNLFRLIQRNLLYFRGVNVAVMVGVGVATAVLTGALLVGDSLHLSLRDLAVRRLGPIDQALFVGRFFDDALARRLSDDPALGGRFEIVPAAIVQGGAAVDPGTAKTAGVQILGVGGDWVPVASGASILNGVVAEALGLTSAGGTVVLSVPTPSDVPPDAILARRSRQDTLSGLRAGVTRIVTEPGMISLFTPAGGQRTPQNIWVNLTDLQDAVGQRGRVNTLLVHDKTPAADAAQQLNAALARVATLTDYGLGIGGAGSNAEAALTSRATYLGPAVEAAATRAAADAGIPLRRISIHLLNAIERLTADGKVASSIHYAVAAGIDPLDDTALAPDEVALNAWAAEQLGAKVGDRLAFAFYRRQPNGDLVEADDRAQGSGSHFRVARILPMSGIGADPSLTPTYHGLTDAASIADWNPPAGINIDHTLVTKADEDYWKKYKAAPKVFFSETGARHLWDDPLSGASSFRVPAARADAFAQKLLAHLDPAAMGLAFRPLRREQLAAAEGTTDFGELFVSFSFFIIAAAVLLLAMLLRLGVEQRARQLGLMAAIGFSPASLTRLVLYEYMMLSMDGGLTGCIAGIGYTWLMMAGLRTWWVGAVGTTAMQLHVVPQTLATGFIAGQVVAFLTIVWAVWRVGRTMPATLLGGGWETPAPARRHGGRVSVMLGVIGLLAGAGFIAAGVTAKLGREAAFMGGGATLLTAGLCFLSAALRMNRRRANIQGDPGAARSITRLAMRNATRHPARSLLCVALIALAAFALVTVAAMRQGDPADTGEPHSGSGGYRLIVESTIPLLGDPATPAGRGILGLLRPTDPIWDRVQLMPMGRHKGQDVSCLNLTQPTQPTILSVPHALVERNAFVFAATPSGTANPWQLLEQSDGAGDIPIIADDNTAEYSLHLALGQTLEITDAAGAPRRLRLVATLAGSIFQSQLLMGETSFRKLFPADSGWGVVLVGVSAQDQDQVRRLLSDELSDYAESVRTTASVIGAYLEVQNAYLSTFEVLGALGLVLGTIGLAVVLVRNVLQRKAELSLLAALGFSPGARLGVVLAENIFLLVTGLILGSFCAAVGILPALLASVHGANIRSLALALAAALFSGLGASGVAVLLSGRGITPADLRRE